MRSFVLKLQDATRSEEIGGVTEFVGEDASGSFGILAGHARFMTSLTVGLARFRIAKNEWKYLALPGALLYFHDNRMILNTRRYLLDDDYTRISQALREQLLAEEQELNSVRESLHRMEQEILKRLWEMGDTATG